MSVVHQFAFSTHAKFMYLYTYVYTYLYVKKNQWKGILAAVTIFLYDMSLLNLLGKLSSAKHIYMIK